MWIPTPDSESLPYAYVTAGGIAALSVNNLLVCVSGGTMITLGSLIWIARRQHRRWADRTARTRYVQAPALGTYWASNNRRLRARMTKRTRPDFAREA